MEVKNKKTTRVSKLHILSCLCPNQLVDINYSSIINIYLIQWLYHINMT
jgi:hypothetical protein